MLSTASCEQWQGCPTQLFPRERYQNWVRDESHSFKVINFTPLCFVDIFDNFGNQPQSFDLRYKYSQVNYFSSKGLELIAKIVF